MDRVERFVNKHIGIIQIVGGILATAISVTVFAYTTFATKQEVKDSIQDQREILLRVEKNVDFLIEKALDKSK
jgi:hypothetical protein